MEESRKLVKQSKDYSEWYTDVILKAELADYSPVKGCMVIRPYGYALWENIQRILDKMIKDTGHVNAYFPLLIPESFLKKEAEHVKGFAPEVAVVTHAGGKKLEEPLIIRPTSETIIYSMYAKWIMSWRDLPLLINQWANIVRWEMRTRLFLRTTEFLWQEGHTAHETRKEAIEETFKMLEVYRNFSKNYLAIPVIKGVKTESQKFAGAMDTYCIEAMMEDKKALQMGTSHDLGQNFSKAFDITFQNRESKQEYVWQSCWGVSTRLIGAIIMSHGDDKGLILPPNIAPIQVVVVLIWKTEQEKKDVKEVIGKIKGDFEGVKVFIDEREQYSPGWKYHEWELKGVPLRIEIGPRDIKDKQAIFARRDKEGKEKVKLTEINRKIKEVLKDIQENMLKKRVDFMNENTFTVNDYNEFKKKIEDPGGFLEACWCGSKKCESKIQEETKATIRCMPLDSRDKKNKGKCLCCAEEGGNEVIFAKAY